MSLLKNLLGLSLSLALVACKSTPQTSENSEEINETNQSEQVSMIEEFSSSDPFEAINRPMWDFNWNVLDKYLIRPVTQVYVDYTPNILQESFLNMVLNLDEPATFFNSLLQFKVQDAVETSGRFAINTTMGVLGAFDVASSMGIERRDETFGQTLAVWGVPDGPYVVLPFLGPTTTADFVGRVVDSMYFPTTVLGKNERFIALGLKVGTTRALLMDQNDLIDSSLDSYSFMKEIYYQRQTFRDYDGQPPEEELPEFDDEEFDESDFESDDDSSELKEDAEKSNN